MKKAYFLNVPMGAEFRDVNGILLIKCYPMRPRIHMEAVNAVCVRSPHLDDVGRHFVCKPDEVVEVDDDVELTVGPS